MIVIMESGASPENIAGAEEQLKHFGFKVYRSQGETHTVLGAVGQPKRDVDERELALLPGVREVKRISKPYKLVERTANVSGTVVDASGCRIGGDDLVIVAGPCAVESREKIKRSAAEVRMAGAHMLRAGAFKPRSSPYSFQGLGEEGLCYLREAADAESMPCVTEVLDASQVDLVAQYVDVLQVGARNMQNFFLLSALGRIDKPILLKRGMAATIEELLLSAEYIVASGNPKVILCERGVRTFSTSTRNTLDLSAIPVLRKLTHLPVLVDPSHATGLREYVAPMARSAVAAGADGIMVEVHPDPDRALSDGPQSLKPHAFAELMADLRIIAPAVRRRLPTAKKQKPSRIQEPLFSNMTVIGVGMMGASLALGFRESGVVNAVNGVDVPEAFDAINNAGVVDQVFEINKLSAAVETSDLVVIATPVHAIVQTLGIIAPHLKPGTLVTDIGSTKAEICDTAKTLPEHVPFIGGHPMTGSERKGAAFADPLMFFDAVWALCPGENVSKELLARFRHAIGALGALPILFDPKRHDRLAAATSHVPRLIAAALSNSVGRLSKEDALAPQLAAGGFRDLTRTATSPYAMWKDIFETNQTMILERLDAFQNDLSKLKNALSEHTVLESEFAEAAAYRLNVPQHLQGLVPPEAELIVRLEDTPGALASIVTPLATEKINVRDIQVLKQRQDEDGVLRIAFADSRTAQLAAEVLRRSGHHVRSRTEEN